MAQPQNRVVEELNRLWNQVLLKGKLQDKFKTLKEKAATSDFPSLQLPPGGDYQRRLLEGAKAKVNSSMSAYEDFIGISQVKAAHEQVLQGERKFVQSQNERRDAQLKLTDVQNSLRILRAEIDRTARGDDRYLEIIKREIDVIKEERFLRSRFEELEKTEREAFSDLSSSLRFSHEKERAQNEKTKYWSVIGSVIGAVLGVLGTTLNSRMKQAQTKAILHETSSHVDNIEKTVAGLAAKLQAAYQIDKENSHYLISGKLKEQEARLEERTEALLRATRALEGKMKHLIVSLSGLVDREPKGLNPSLRVPLAFPPNSKDVDLELPPQESNIWVTLAGVLLITAFAYKYT